MKILIADDNCKNRELLRTVLAHLGHEVIEAANGAEALHLARCNEIEIFILDLQMPELDGYEAARRLRAGEHAATPMIAVTAYAMQGDEQRALEAGFSSYLSKPVRLARIREELARWSRTNE